VTDRPREVAWLMIEPGWKVVASDGSEIGEVESIVGDTGVDIFNGLSITTGLLSPPRYVPAERVARIEEGRVRLALTRKEFEQLSEFEEPPATLEIEGDSASATDRIADVFVDPDAEPRRITMWSRLVRKLFRR
jgi:hypothetical protein